MFKTSLKVFCIRPDEETGFKSVNQLKLTSFLKKWANIIRSPCCTWSKCSHSVIQNWKEPLHLILHRNKFWATNWQGSCKDDFLIQYYREEKNISVHSWRGNKSTTNLLARSHRDCCCISYSICKILLIGHLWFPVVSFFLFFEIWITHPRNASREGIFSRVKSM